jgi:hypothetical protein
MELGPYSFYIKGMTLFTMNISGFPNYLEKFLQF